MRWLLLLLAGCAAKEEIVGVTKEPPRVKPPEPPALTSPMSPTIALDTRIARACNIAPATDDELLDRIASCMTQGSLQNDTVRIVAHFHDPPAEWSAPEAAALSDSIAERIALRGVARERLRATCTEGDARIAVTL
jgi:hypothetical protein